MTCNTCGVDKTLDEFRKRTDRGEYRFTCLECEKVNRHDNYLRNREKRLLMAKEYAEKNKDVIAVYNRGYRLANRPRLLQYDKDRHAADPEYRRRLAREWVKENPERHYELTRKWAVQNPEKVRAAQQRRRARVEGNGGTYNAEAWITLVNLCGNRCLCCGVSGLETKLTVDHVKPIARGGLNIISNLQPLCQSCNSKKCAKEIDYRNAENKSSAEFLQAIEGFAGEAGDTSGVSGASEVTPQAI